VQPSCQNAEVVEAFCRAAASRSNTRRSIQQPRPLLHFTRPAEMPPLHSLRFALASRLPSRTAPTLNPHSARCLAGAQLPAISCLGAFRPPALGVRGETVIPAAENLHKAQSRCAPARCAGARAERPVAVERTVIAQESPTLRIEVLSTSTQNGAPHERDQHR